MERYSDEKLAEALRELRPTPHSEFAAKLDERAAAGFPPPERPPGEPARSRLRRALARLRAMPPRRLVLPAVGLAVAVIGVAAVAVTTAGEEEPRPGGALLGYGSYAGEGRSDSTGDEAVAAGAAPEASEDLGSSAAAPPTRTGDGAASRARNRDVERSAELTLATDPAAVAGAASQVFDAVHAHRGIVLRSSTREGAPGEAGAEFELLVPSGRLADALAALSAIAEVRSRREATADITAPTVGVEERLQDSRARIDGLLAQLAEAGTEAEREAVEAELRGERRRTAFLRSRLARLHRRANFARVSVRIQTGSASSSSGGAWGVGAALDDAGRILAVAAGVALVGLAVLGPLALIALLAWLARRAWLHRARQRALG